MRWRIKYFSLFYFTVVELIEFDLGSIFFRFIILFVFFVGSEVTCLYSFMSKETLRMKIELFGWLINIGKDEEIIM